MKKALKSVNQSLALFAVMQASVLLYWSISERFFSEIMSINFSAPSSAVLLSSFYRSRHFVQYADRFSQSHRKRLVFENFWSRQLTGSTTGIGRVGVCTRFGFCISALALVIGLYGITCSRSYPPITPLLLYMNPFLIASIYTPGREIYQTAPVR